MASAFAMGQGTPIILGPPPAPPEASQAPAPNPIPDIDKRPRVGDGTRLQLIGSINAEFVRVRKICPVGFKDMILTPEGAVKPDDARLYRMGLTYGAAAKVGDKVQITNVVFKDKAIYLEINGGPKKKSKWYDHISVGGASGTVGGVDSNQGQATGSAITLQFKEHVPEMNATELKQLLQPVLDFTVRTAAEVYVDTLPPKVREAIKKHEVLVGMNRDMVISAKERPPQKVREKDEKGNELEEWIYGATPQDVVFVLFSGDEVTQVKTMKMGGEKIVRTEKEVDVKEGVASMASIKRQGEDPSADAQSTTDAPRPTKRPTLRRPDEAPDDAVQRGTASTGATQKETPQWGTDGQEKPPIDVSKPQTKPPQR
ncbi:MAG TPA: hypothetical protein VNW97_05750 [Candidatus Saccharimonadales bacterium]|nr:hypothetical protein [Candidatus Saccharimonadales bacterium]